MKTPRVCKKALANTIHPQKLSETAIWHALEGQVHNPQTDFNVAHQRLSPVLTKQTQDLSQALTLGAIKTLF